MAAKFWVGGGTNTNWNASPVTNWANSSGGTGNQTAPVTGDDVTFDNSSGTAASVWNTTISLNSLTCSNSRNLVTHNNAITITISGGNLSLPGGAGATYTAANNSAIFTISGTSGTQQITSNGKNFGGLTLNGVSGTFQFQDNVNCTVVSASTITLTNGTLDGQTFTVSTSIFSSNNSNTRVLKGSGAWTISSTTNNISVWNCATVTGLDLSNFSSSITLSGSATGNRTFAGGGKTYTGGISLGSLVTTAVWSITGSNTFGSLAITTPSTVIFTTGATTTISTAFTLAGSVGNLITFLSTSPGTLVTISISAGSATMSWCVIRDTTFSGGATFTAYNSFDAGNNTGITIYPPNVTRSRIAA